MRRDQSCMSRNCRQRRIFLFAPLAAIPLTTFIEEVRAGSASKDALHYQDSPKDGKRCADCAAFLGATAENSGELTCKLVAGPISANGWCIAFSKR